MSYTAEERYEDLISNYPHFLDVSCILISYSSLWGKKTEKAI
jgi:hypothetical protein